MTTLENKVKNGIAAVDDGLNTMDVSKINAAWTTLKPSIIELLTDLRTPRINAAEEEWAQALLRQAQEDLTAAQTLANSHGETCESVVCMLIQMTFEKIAKAQLARTDRRAFVNVRMSHVAASRLIKTITSHGNHVGLKYKWKDVLPFIKALELAHPAITKQGPHLEYPWEITTTVRNRATDIDELEARVLTPAADLQVVRDIFEPRTRPATDLLRLAQELINRFDELFPA
jgi:hypothetical protein